MLVARVLVAVDVQVARGASAIKPPCDVITLGSPAVAVDASQAEAAIRKELFTGAMLENSPTRPQRRTVDFVVSGTVQTIFLTGLLFLPLYFSEAIDIHQFSDTLLRLQPEECVTNAPRTVISREPVSGPCPPA